MLVLSRKRDEAVVIGDGKVYPLVTVIIVEIRGDKVRLGIAAPAEVPVHRDEVYDAIQRENARAACREFEKPSKESLEMPGE